MTLVVCLKCDKGLVLAADSRGTLGDPRGLTAIVDNMVKIFKLSDYVGVLLFGQAEIAAQLIQEIKKKLTETDKYISNLLPKIRTILRFNYNEWFKNLGPDARRNIVVGFIITGLEEDKTSKTYYLNSNLDFAPQLVVTGIAMGGIPQYATYLTNRLYNPNMSIEEGITLAYYVISETATQDPKVGGPVRVVKITENNLYEEISFDFMKQIIEKSDKINKSLKDYFFGDNNIE